VLEQVGSSVSRLAMFQWSGVDAGAFGEFPHSPHEFISRC
jgi:hypothetical protein